LINYAGIVLCGEGDAWVELLYLDFNGKIISYCICGHPYNPAGFMIQTTDDGYLIIDDWNGNTVYKMNSTGDSQGNYWLSYAAFSSACELSEGYLVAGYNRTGGENNNSFVIALLDKSFKEVGKIGGFLPSIGLINSTVPLENNTLLQIRTEEIIPVSNDEAVLVGNKNQAFSDGWWGHSCIWLMKIKMVDHKPVQTFLVRVAPPGDPIISNPRQNNSPSFNFAGLVLATVIVVSVASTIFFWRKSKNTKPKLC
jgi:hypothetical protein